MKIVLVCGGRDYKDKVKVFDTLDSVLIKYQELMIVTGSARGADLLAEEWAKSREIPYMGFPAMWKKYGKSAGMIRNKFMLETSKASAVIAFSGGIGTAGMIGLARKARISVWEVK